MNARYAYDMQNITASLISKIIQSRLLIFILILIVAKKHLGSLNIEASMYI